MNIDSQPSAVLHAAPVELPDFARRYVNLADADFGAKVLYCSDEWFAPAERMLQSASPVFVVGKFDDHGKWMDGWETQRRRNGGMTMLSFNWVYRGNQGVILIPAILLVTSPCRSAGGVLSGWCSR
jgi:allantoicase